MATASTSGPALAHGPGRVVRALALPAGCALLAVMVSTVVGHVLIGLLLAGGVALGAVNGLLMESATARMTQRPGTTRDAIVKGSLGRLGVITLIALAVAILARPNGWLVLIGLAGYQLLSLAATLGAAAKEARVG
ncbi:MAG: hypothetical protein NVS3B26_26600 [Mycobacteriales bacterium]